MTSSFPATLDTFVNPTASDALNSGTVPHASQHANLNDAVKAIQTALGINLANVGNVFLAVANTFTQPQTANSFIPTSATIPTNGIYLPSANTVGIATNSGIRFQVSPLGQVNVGSTSLTLGGGGVAQQFGVVSQATTTVGAVIRGAASQTANLQEWQNSAGTVVAYVRNDGLVNTTTGILATGAFIAAGGYLSGTQMASVANTATTIGLIVKGAASQTANLQEWQDSAGTVLASVSNAGDISGKRVAITQTNAGQIVLDVLGAASQTADLQQWRNSTGTVLASITAAGIALKPQPTPNAQTANATLTVANLLTQIITSTSAVAVALTLPTGTLTSGGFTSIAVNQSFDWSVINLGSALGAMTLTAGTAHTIVGNAVVAIGTSSQWRSVNTASNTWVTYRIS